MVLVSDCRSDVFPAVAVKAVTGQKLRKLPKFAADNYGQLRIPIMEFSADTGSHIMNVVNTQPTH